MNPLRHLMILALLAVFGVAACAPVFRNHGYVPPDIDLAQVVPGQTTADQLPELIGRPSAQGLLTGSGWYYVGSRWRHYGAQQPQEIDRQVVAISFAENGVVTNVERFGLERGRVITLSRRVTEGGVQQISLIAQLMRNVGNVTAGQIIE
ncbi:outer membrane protein assembly factor BamE [Paracoccus sp. (in: a-proteobacteria)]|uniref:outer membrane protein assembly factor BamE n=1 Tax=Paracoccus sp. TaxID=267 RepID=UPI0026DF857D|nr:outer membrane protein assembly factor BamE [Paracoccus sp. (in: a-proteobacteria)]MDO5646948.1 outer membrane protein assembly factor BamE [Paracoccus sp. (in: a-proteobacteria)]